MTSRFSFSQNQVEITYYLMLFLLSYIQVLSDADSSIISNSVRSSLTTIVENDNLLFYGLYCEFMGCFEGSGSGQRYLLPQTNCSTFLSMLITCLSLYIIITSCFL